MTDSTLTQPVMGRCVSPPVIYGETVHLAPLDSPTGREHCYDVRIGVGFPDDVAGFAATVEDDPVVLVVVSAAVPHRHWELSVGAVGHYHQANPAPLLDVLPDGATTFMSILAMPEAWKDGAW